MKYFTRRIIAGILDTIILSMFTIWYFYQYGEIGDNGLPELNGFSHLLALFIVWFICFPLPEGLTGYTLFKYLFDVKVVSVTGKPISITQSLKRHFFDPIDYFFGIGAILAFKRPQHQRIGDVIAKTKVVSELEEIESTETNKVIDLDQTNVEKPLTNKPYLTRRICAFVIDYTVLFLVLYGLISIFGTVAEDGSQKIEGISGAFVMFFPWLVIIVLPEAYFGYSLGKGAFNLRVVAESSKRNKYLLSFLRHLFDIIEICLFFGLFSAILIKTTDKHQRIGDIIAGSRVVYDDRD